MQIDPKIPFWLGVWTSVLLLIGGGTVNLSHALPAAWIPTINAWCVLLGTINNVILTALAGYSSSAKGPLVSAPSVSPAVKALLGFVVVAVALSFAMPAKAQNGWPTFQRPVAAKRTVAPRTQAATAKLTATQVQQNPFTLLENMATADLQAALDDANAQTPPDTVGANCYSALIALKSNPAFALPSGSVPGVFTAVQKARDLQTQLANIVSPTGPLANLNSACAAWTQSNMATLIAIGGAVGLVANPAGAAAAVAGFPAAMAAFLAAIPK